MMQPKKRSPQEAEELLNFILRAPCEDEIIAMDCNDYCNDLARLAEQVAAGANLCDLLPKWEEHMRHWKDCREEFEALVSVLRAEAAEEL